jgi:hypothetical protein
MKRFLILTFVAFAASASVALASGGGESTSPAQFCKAELKKLGASDFKALYAPNGPASSAFGKCVSKHAKTAKTNDANAAKACKAELELPVA